MPTSCTAANTSASAARTLGSSAIEASSASSTHAKAANPATAGQRPRRSGYGSGSGSLSPRRRLAVQPAARPIARHGLNARKTSPKSTLRTGMPTQNRT
jgi:hypothetical protein